MKCKLCRKSELRCNCNKSGRDVAAGQKTKAGATVKNNGWCSKCGCYVRDGRCSNVTCSTNR